ncbi:MAG: DUF882 domain-containing protein [Synergistaceae bacterium]|nr:DUF882 domain-containing protein [Synergistaceae bacterium]
MNDTKNFSVKEFACHHCGQNKIDQRVIDLCQKIRDELGVPVRVNSGYRCPAHNARVGGVKGSRHVLGHAADLSSSRSGMLMFEAVKRLQGEGRLPELGYCILYKTKNFIHVDIDKRPSGSMWEVRP